MNSSSTISTDDLLDDLTSNDFETRWFAAEIIGTKRDLTPDQITRVINIAKASDVGEVLIWGLGMMKALGSEEFIGTFLEHENNYYRWRAAEALRDLGTQVAVTVLSNALNNSNQVETRWKCAWALGEIGSLDSFEVLWDRAEHDTDRYVRWKAIFGISLLRGDVEKLLREKYENGGLSNFMAWRLAWVLGRIGDKSTLTWLERMKIDYEKSKYVLYQINLSIRSLKEHHNR